MLKKFISIHTSFDAGLDNVKMDAKVVPYKMAVIQGGYIISIAHR
jgi:hypothetical protein